jgi:hypothetical protein
LDVWHEIIGRLEEQHLDKLNWTCFDGHGYLVSFDQKIINAQLLSMLKKVDEHNPQWGEIGDDTCIVDIDLMSKLGFTCIESWKSSDVNVFYKRDRKKVVKEIIEWVGVLLSKVVESLTGSDEPAT